MLLYADDLVLLAPSRSDLTTALEELERITRNEEVGHGGQLPQDRGSGVWPAYSSQLSFSLPAAATAATIQVDPTAWQSSLPVQRQLQ